MTAVDRPALSELLADLHVVAIPLHTRFRGITVREVTVLRGPAGWAEFGPFPEYGDDEASRWLAAALEAAWVGWPAPVRDRVPVNATVPAVAASAVPAVLARYPGCTTAKVKVAEPGQRLADDLDRVAAVRDALGPAGRIRVDANGGWSLDEARHALAALRPFGLEYAEQPCRTVEDLARLRVLLARDGVDVLVAADESIRKSEDPLAVARLAAADIVVIKAAPLAGVRAALTVVEQAGLPAVVSSALETSVGMSAGIALAAALPQLPYACGLGTLGLFQGDVVSRSLAPRDGVVPVGAVEPDPELLQRWAADPARQGWWRDRIGRVHAVLDRS